MTDGGTIDDGWRRKAMPAGQPVQMRWFRYVGLPLLTSVNTRARQWNAPQILLEIIR